MQAIALARTSTSEPRTASQALLAVLDSIADSGIKGWKLDDCTDEQAAIVSSWVDANTDRYYLCSDDRSIEVIRRDGLRLLLKWWRK
jgi:hypothetical protein